MRDGAVEYILQKYKERGFPNNDITATVKGLYTEYDLGWAGMDYFLK